jgi:hypothetical protein
MKEIMQRIFGGTAKNTFDVMKVFSDHVAAVTRLTILVIMFFYMLRFLDSEIYVGFAQIGREIGFLELRIKLYIILLLPYAAMLAIAIYIIILSSLIISSLMKFLFEFIDIVLNNVSEKCRYLILIFLFIAIFYIIIGIVMLISVTVYYSSSRLFSS